MARRTYTTYCIKDPDTGDIVYVGQTRDFKKRCESHLTLRDRPNIGSVNIKTWLFDLLSAGKTPIIEVLEECRGKRASLVSETTWVAKFAGEGKGSRILNKWREHKAALKHGEAAWHAATQRTAMPSNHGRKWSFEENDLARQLTIAGKAPKEIAKQLGRTPRAVRLQMDRLESSPTSVALSAPRMAPLFSAWLEIRALFNLLASNRSKKQPFFKI